PVKPPLFLTAEPGYSLTFHASKAGYPGKRYSDDLSTALSKLEENPFLRNGPIYDVFSPDMKAQFVETTSGDSYASYEPNVYLSVSRSFGSYIRDLFIPSKADISIGRFIERIEDDISDEIAGSIQLRATALNLFGFRGAYPFFKSYESEEISWSTGISAKYIDDKYAEITPLLQNFLVFRGMESEELIIENRLELSFEEISRWNNTMNVDFSWINRVKNGLYLPIVNIDIKNNVYFTHIESISAEFGNDPAKLDFLLGHSSSLNLDDFGRIDGVLKVGVSHKSDVWFLGIQGGVKAKIAF
ncbi:MAG: hypothetical protein HN368_13635, partial [Spirochaetales bacterium]|nr:hypothetical protein [Spirochaetales bacterium]